MINLVPMTAQEFDEFLERDIREYAQECVQAGFWTEVEALQRSRKEHRALLPDGLKTRYHHLYMIREPDRGETVGVLWLKTDLDSSKGSGFIYDLEIFEQCRRKGYARESMLELEKLARGMGVKQLGLNVFSHNEGARALYEGLSYKVASYIMLKDL